MHVAVSPYHATTREAPLMAALLLADRVTTLLPTPPEGVSEDAVRQALIAHPRYFRLLDTWRWMAPLWRSGLVDAVLSGEDAIDDVHSCNEAFTRDDRWRTMRPFLHNDLMSQDRFLDRASQDLLKGGPDPGVSVPVVAGLDALACRHGLIVMRAGAGAGGDALAAADRGSIAQRAEARLGRTLFSLAVPILTQADAAAIERARKMLRVPLQNLRAAISAAITESGAVNPAAVREAARRYAEAFRTHRAELIEAPRGEMRIIDSYVALSCRQLPIDAAIMSSIAAVRHVSGRPAGEPGAAGDASITVLVVSPMTAVPIS